MRLSEKVEIVRRVKNGENQTSIASEFGVSKQTITKIEQKGNEYLESAGNNGDLGRKRLYSASDSNCAEIDRRIFDWYKVARGPFQVNISDFIMVLS